MYLSDFMYGKSKRYFEDALRRKNKKESSQGDTLGSSLILIFI